MCLDFVTICRHFFVIATETSQIGKSMGNVPFSILLLLSCEKKGKQNKTKGPKQDRQNRLMSPMPKGGQPMFCRILQRNPSTF